MPWETTENYIRSGHKSKSLFVDGSQRTITISESKGIKAIVGKLKSDPNGSTVIQSYLFSKSKGWTLSKAKSWFNSHKSSAHIVEHAFEFSFLAGVHKLDAAKHNATFYLMNTSRNRNKWGVTAKALSEALPSLKGKPLGLFKGYKIENRHPKQNEILDVGKFSSFENKENYALGTAHVEDQTAWNMLESGDLGPISVVILGYHVACSKCNLEFPAEKGQAAVLTHEHIKDGSAYEQVHSFSFRRVDFVKVPAYPQAGILDLAASTENIIPIELLAGFYESQGHSKEFTKKGAKNLPETEKELEELKEKMANLEQTNKQLNADHEALKKASAEKDKELKKLKAAKKTDAGKEDNEKIKALEEKIAAMEKEKKDNLIAEVLAARTESGIAGKEEEEKEMLAGLSESALKQMKVDALKVASITKTKSQPKLRYSSKESEPLDEAVNKMRANFGFADGTENINKMEKN